MDDLSDDVTIAIPTPANPAGEAAKAELAAIMSDPNHKMHQGWLRSDPTVKEHVKTAYKKAYPDTPPETTAQGTPPAPAPRRDPAPTMTPEDRAAQAEVEGMLRNTLGESYDATMADMGIGAQHLFAVPGGEKILAELSPLIVALGPLAQVRGIRFLAELGQLKKQQGGRS
jgi:hypothetical protein